MKSSPALAVALTCMWFLIVGLLYILFEHGTIIFAVLLVLAFRYLYATRCPACGNIITWTEKYPLGNNIITMFDNNLFIRQCLGGCKKKYRRYDRDEEWNKMEIFET